MNKKHLTLSIAGFILVGIFIYLIFLGGNKEFVNISQESVMVKEEIQEVDNVEIESEKEESAEVKDPADTVPSSIEENLEKSIEIKKEPEEKVQEKTLDKAVSSLNIKNNLVSFGFSKSSGRKIDTIIIHSSYNSLEGDQYDVKKIIAIYESYGVAAHYIIARDGSIIRLVEEKNIAYHAGVSEVPDGRNNVNNFSIGIEMVGNKTDGYTDNQYKAVSDLVDDIKNRYELKYVLGHKDIAPDRKDDPWKFDFDKLK